MPHQKLFMVMVLTAFLLPVHEAGAAYAKTAVCALRESQGIFTGTCDIPIQVNELAVNFDGIRPGFKSDKPARNVPVTLKKTANGWVGTMPGRQPEDPTLFEIVNDSQGKAAVGKLPFGWFRVATFDVKNGGMNIVFNIEKQAPPTEEDVKILSRAREILSSNKVWNRQDTRQCPDNATTWSLFCSLIKATKEVTGGLHYRQPAMQSAREVLNKVGQGRFGKHRIQDYNNHPDTTLDEVRDLLKQAEDLTQKRMMSATK